MRPALAHASELNMFWRAALKPTHLPFIGDIALQKDLLDLNAKRCGSLVYSICTMLD